MDPRVSFADMVCMLVDADLKRLSSLVNTVRPSQHRSRPSGDSSPAPWWGCMGCQHARLHVLPCPGCDGSTVIYWRACRKRGVPQHTE